MGARIRYDNQLIKLISLFSSITKTQPKDCFVDGMGLLTFVVDENMGLAIGRGGENIRRLEDSLKRRIKVVEFAPQVDAFVANLLRPLKVQNVEVKDNIVIITPAPESRGFIIGRAAQNLRNYESIVKRYFDVKELRVV
jgi:transcription termination/antitermination protein NusA